MFRIGIDIGSTYTKTCVLNDDYSIQRLSSDITPIRQKEFFRRKLLELQDEYSEVQIASCGYGKANIASLKSVSELTALACGSESIMPGMEVILDIGGQDTKIIIQKNGKLKEFFVNDKCAAGCGMFLGNTLNLLQMEFNEIDLNGIIQPELKLSTTCAVFAQSEIVGLLAQDCLPDIIIQAVIWQILQQAKMLLMKVNCSQIVLSGGFAQIKGIEKYAENAFQKTVLVSEYSNYLSAIGCAQLLK